LPWLPYRKELRIRSVRTALAAPVGATGGDGSGMEGSNGVPRKNEHHLALLPTEILLIIISYLDNDLDDSQLILDPRNVCQRRFTTLRDVASLSLTCWRLRNLVR
jgi:hypothetical protein